MDRRAGELDDHVAEVDGRKARHLMRDQLWEWYRQGGHFVRLHKAVTGLLERSVTEERLIHHRKLKRFETVQTKLL